MPSIKDIDRAEDEEYREAQGQINLSQEAQRIIKDERLEPWMKN